MEKDIVKAIEKEKEYLGYRKQGKEPFHLVDVIKECGFESLSEYFEEKTKYEFEHLQFKAIETSPEKAVSDIMNCIINKKTTILFAETPFTLVWNGINSSFNETYCKEHQIPVFPLYTGGGTIVSTKGDLNIGICVPDRNKIKSYFVLNGLVKIFQKYTNKNVVIDGNDILIDNKKVVGSATYRLNNMFVFIAPVSLTEKTELINNICVKKSSKTPTHIDFMTANELKQEVTQWLLA